MCPDGKAPSSTATKLGGGPIVVGVVVVGFSLGTRVLFTEVARHALRLGFVLHTHLQNVLFLFSVTCYVVNFTMSVCVC